ncbi:hypothetical protein IW261DRAFT_1488319 [Armillaria novae-zelandiae]|uniref:Uncharacterized protein n=1 Tax=Armillaria novae-zelandiae TaxID=153914 RepID=A0AA39P4B6_9AGAR|nr:hypothetical protein IW261DRAFT_1488319 [Armillaria novae-zelandiae]
MSIYPLFVRGDNDSSPPMCSHNNFWQVLLCVEYVEAAVGACLARRARLILLGTLIHHCVLDRRAINGCAACREGTKRKFPIIINFYFYLYIPHPIRCLRVLRCSSIYPRFRTRTIVTVPRYNILLQELCKVIIRFCSSERETLFTCSLVCKARAPTSRCLFYTYVHSRDHVPGFVKLLQSRDNICLRIFRQSGLRHTQGKTD